MEETESLDPLITALDDCSISCNESNEKFTICFEDDVINCDKKLLLNHAKYFEAYNNFSSLAINADRGTFNKHSSCDSIEIKGEISRECCQTIVEALVTKKLNINLSNFQEILQGAVFLQCEVVESSAVAFIISKLNWENCFHIYCFAKSISSKKLKSSTEQFIAKNFVQLLPQTESAVDDFLASSRETITSFLCTDHQCYEELIYYATIAWIGNNSSLLEEGFVNLLLSKINFYLFHASSLQTLLEDETLQDSFPFLLESVASAVEYHKWNADKKVQFWRKNGSDDCRWPKMAVVASTGNFQGDIGCLDLQKCRLAWRKLAKKPSEIRKKAMGSGVVLVDSRLYFLGGEGCWQLAWYDLEDNRWGVAPGLPPARLLAGVAALGSVLYLIGGVSVADGCEVVTTGSVDCYDTITRVWSLLRPLDEGRSSPGVATVDFVIYVFGGLRRRNIVTSCCRYLPQADKWEQLADLPTDMTSFTTVVVGDKVVLIGGMNNKYRCLDTTYVYHTKSNTWTQGAKLNIARKSAAGFCYNGNVYVCGGTADELKYLESTEILDTLGGEWKTVEIPFKNWKSYMAAVIVKKPVRFLMEK